MSCYDGPAGVILTDDELLVIWQRLCVFSPDSKSDYIRDKIKRYLERNNVKEEVEA